MSFFGFDASGPPPRLHNNDDKVYDFQDTYEGLGEYEEDDALNSETFNVNQVGKNFDFSSSTLPGSNSASAARPNLSFARAAANDDEFMKDLWGENTPEPKHAGPGTSVPTTRPPEEKRILSLEEIEAQLTAIDPSESRKTMPPPHQQMYPGMPPQFNGYMMPQGYIPPNGHYGMPYPGHFLPMQAPINQMNQQTMPVMHNMQAPHLVPAMAQVHPHVAQPPMSSTTYQDQASPAASDHAVHQASTSASTSDALQQAVPQTARPGTVPSQTSHPSSDMSQFPVLGSKKQGISSQPLPQHHIAPRLPDYQGQRQHVPMESLLPVEQARLAKRQEKVSKIMRYSGVMNPKDKDFVTRFQLSQIVTDDPYNEDFYAQVYKVIHPKSGSNGLGEVEPNSIAQAYLDQSGHRLGGRHKRADVALQRMQQQVQKAVTVAKERQKLPHNARGGVLGKISVGSGKKPRQQLVILSTAAQKAKENQVEQDELEARPKKTRSSSIAAPTKPIKKFSKKDIMCILEEIMNNLMAVESESRLSTDVDTTKLWESLHVLDQASSSGDEESFVNPFVQCLNFSKALKILPRLFKFLSREQILTVITLVMSNLENLKVIKDGSYTTYDSKQLPDDILKLVETYSLTFCKVLMNAVQDFKFNEIIKLLLILIQHNVVSFVSTTKIGLSVLTTLLSRAELMRGEGTISATDLSEWTSCYDELFTSLESRIAAIFPPSHSDTEDDYVWQFLATLSLGGKLSHQRIIVDEVRDEIFGVMNRAKAINNNDMANLYKKQSMLNNLNMYLVVMGLVADENEIQELKN